VIKCSVYDVHHFIYKQIVRKREGHTQQELIKFVQPLQEKDTNKEF